MGLKLISRPLLKRVLQGFCKWEIPPVNWVKLNKDASVIGDNLRASIGGVARGRWLWDYSAKLGCLEIDRAELHAVKMGM